jgi:glycosyltransferase involved in cell wall biosynthesis
MIGRHPGYVTTQGEILGDHFASAGYPVISVSTSPSRYVRLLDIVTTLMRRRHDVDIQCLQVFGGPSFVVEDLASWFGRRFGQRIIMVLRGGAMPEFMARHPQWTRRVLSRADALVAPSAFLAHAVVPYGFQAQVIFNVIDLSKYPYRPRKAIGPRLFWMRSFHPVYNPLMAIRVLARLRSTMPTASLVMAGQDKGLEFETRRLAEELGLNGAVHFPGFLDTAAKVKEGDAADIYINTNHVDNMPVTVVEACAMGLPVVATAVGGVPDLLTDGETGLLVPDNDDQAMTAAIQRLLNDPALAMRLSTNGRQLAERSSWEQVRPLWERIFAEVMARAKHSGMERL